MGESVNLGVRNTGDPPVVGRWCMGPGVFDILFLSNSIIEEVLCDECVPCDEGIFHPGIRSRKTRPCSFDIEGIPKGSV